MGEKIQFETGPNLNLFEALYKQAKKTRKLGPIYTWRTPTGVKLNNNWNQSLKFRIFLAV